MAPATVSTATFRVWVDGNDVSSQISQDLETITVEDNLYLPDTFAIRLRMQLVAGGANNQGGGQQNRPMRWLSDPTFQIGKPVKIKLFAAPDNTQVGAYGGTGDTDPRDHLIDGEITAIEVDMEEDDHVYFIARGFDRSYKLQRGNQVKSYVQMTDSDIVKQIANEFGLDTSNVQGTTEVYPYVLEANQTHLDFLQKRAERIGFELFVDGKKLYFRDRNVYAIGNHTLKPGDNLLRFNARQNSLGEKVEVVVRGWDPLNNREVVGKAKGGQDFSTHMGPGGTETNQNTQTYTFTRPVTTQSEAEQVANGLLYYIMGNYMQMEGSSLGDPRLRAGTWVDVSGFGGQFNGGYYLTCTTHIFAAGRGGRSAGYTVDFKSEGGHHSTLLEATGGQAGGKDAVSVEFGEDGPVPGIVTNLNDPEKLGRVKVKWPHIGDDIESNWARVVSPNHGMMMRPGIGQEVLVAFEDGDLNKPYVIGALWNSKNHPPPEHSTTDHISGADYFVISTPKKNQLILTDKGSNNAGFYLNTGQVIRISGSGDNGDALISDGGDGYIQFDKKDNTLGIGAKKDITIESAEGNITLKASMGKLVIDAKEVEITASTNMKLKGSMIDIN